jgi:hypothetical protein
VLINLTLLIYSDFTPAAAIPLTNFNFKFWRSASTTLIQQREQTWRPDYLLLVVQGRQAGMRESTVHTNQIFSNHFKNTHRDKLHIHVSTLTTE